MKEAWLEKINHKKLKKSKNKIYKNFQSVNPKKMKNFKKKPNYWQKDNLSFRKLASKYLIININKIYLGKNSNYKKKKRR